MELPGQVRPLEGVLEFESTPSHQREIYSVAEIEAQHNAAKVSGSEQRSKSELERENERLRKEINQLKVKEVERQQTHFGKGIND